MDTHRAFVPAKKTWVLCILLVAAVFVLGLCLVLRHTLNTPKPLNAAEYTVAVPEGFTYTVSATAQNGVLVFTGWDLVQGTRFYDVNNWLVLYDVAEDTYTRIPTQMNIDDAATQAIGDGINYSFGGFYAAVAEKKLPAGARAFELCFAVSSKDQNTAYLIHTGKTVAEVLV